MSDLDKLVLWTSLGAAYWTLQAQFSLFDLSEVSKFEKGSFSTSAKNTFYSCRREHCSFFALIS